MLDRLRTQYRDFNEKLGKTGSGLDYANITPGSHIHNQIRESALPTRDFLTEINYFRTYDGGVPILGASTWLLEDSS